MTLRIATAALLVCALELGMAPSAEAELVFFTTGRSMSVKSHRIEGDSIVLALRAGGEVTCDRALVERIEPDEVPYPEPVVVADADPVIAAAPVSEAIPFAEIINAVSAEQGVDAKLVRAVIQVESAYQPRARSHKGAMGLMQLMPGTARQYAVSDPYDPQANIQAGVKHLKSLLQRFELSLALAAYNAGEGAIERFGGIPPYRETRDYVSRILRISGLGTRN